MDHQEGLSPEDPSKESVSGKAAGEFFPESALLVKEKDRYHRLLADFDNFRKRTSLESDRRASAQKEGLIRELLPVIDNFERSLAVGPDTSFQQLLQGVEMILQQIRQILKQNNIESIESAGTPFDPLCHEAIGSRRDPSKPDHSVLEDVQRGYCRGQEVIRPSKVIVNDLGLTE